MKIPIIACDGAPKSVHHAKAWMHVQVFNKEPFTALFFLDDDESGCEAKKEIQSYKGTEKNQKLQKSVCVKKYMREQNLLFL